MAPRRVPRNTMRADERLKLQGPQVELFVKAQELSVENLIVMGASAGGHHALKHAVKGLSHNLPAAVIILLHSDRQPIGEFTLANFLGTSTDLPIQVIQSGERVQAGRVYVTPPGYTVWLQERTLLLEPMVPDHPVTTVNRLFESAAMAYHDRVIGVVLMGLLRDSTAGLQAIQEVGGITLVQDPAEAEYMEIPMNAVRDLPVTLCLRLAEIGPALDILARRGSTGETSLSASLHILKKRMALFKRLLVQSTWNRHTRDFLISELDTVKQDLHATQTLLNEVLAPRAIGS